MGGPVSESSSSEDESSEESDSESNSEQSIAPSSVEVEPLVLAVASSALLRNAALPAPDPVPCT
jgi:hypothetical protein